MSEETINPKKNIPRAIFLVVLIGGVLFTITSYFLHQVYPNFQNYVNAEAISLEIAGYIGGSFMHSLFLAGTMVAVISSSLSSHASASRLLYAMGRDDSLPRRFFGYVHPKLKTPLFNVLFVGVISMTAMFGELEIIYSFISFGALIGFTSVNASVIAHYYIRGQNRSFTQTLRYLVVPGAGAAFCIWLLGSISTNALIIGSAWLLLGLITSL
jgi:putrescine importer